MEQLQQRLMTQQILRGDFKQSKVLQMFNQPLLSDGSFLLSHQQGLIWKQQSPFPVLLVLAKEKLSQQFADQAPEVIEAKDNPMVFYFSHLFLSLFKGDITSLQSQFTMTLSGDEITGWVLHLSPIQPPLNKVFKEIEIKGKETIQTLSLIELNEDSSVIEFTNIKQQQAALTQQEKDAFKF
ncbi:MAG: outer membrane lipoprotein carrier protein LolA [Psychromonas sp.]|nr:outer membrane lipoprotein carrier protein LolA [Psychromonas sp.]